MCAPMESRPLWKGAMIIHKKEGAPNNVLCTLPWVASTNLQDTVPALFQNESFCCGVCGQSQSSRGHCQPPESHEEPPEEGCRQCTTTNQIRNNE